MARKRSITSDMSTDERIAGIATENPTAALMWPWFLTAFDDWGRFDVSSSIKIKLEIFPAFPFKADEIEEAINLYSDAGIVHRYEVDNKTYLAIEPCKYYKYQTYIREDKRRVDKSKYPAPTNAPWATCAKCRALARNCTPSPSPSPSPSKNILSSEHSPDTLNETPDQKPKGAKQTPIFDEDTEQYRLALLMRGCILENLPNAKVPETSPDKLRRWAHDIDLMMRIDKRSPDEIRQLIDWSHKDSFWRANILSPGKLREKWDTLTAQRIRGMERVRGDPKEKLSQKNNFEQRKYDEEFLKSLQNDLE